MAHGSPAAPPARGLAVRSSRVRTVLIMLAGGAALSLVLLFYRVSWWPAPFAISLSHAALGVIAALAFAYITRRRLRGAPSTGTSTASGGMLIRRGASYDWLVRIVLLGRERRFREGLIDLGAVRPGEAVLDVGCGTGTLLMAAADRVGSAGVLRGVEPSPEMLARARAKAEDRHPDLEFTQASADALPFPDGSFDVVFCTMVLHHLPDEIQGTALTEMRRVLRPGGRVVIADLDVRSPGAKVSLVALLHGFGSADASSPMRETAARLRELGFNSVTTHPTRSQAIGCLVARLHPSD